MKALANTEMYSKKKKKDKLNLEILFFKKKTQHI